MNLEVWGRFENAALAQGVHSDRSNGLCALEWVAYLAGEEHSDHPACSCPIVSAFVRSWNDSLSDADRDRLVKPLVPLLLNSRSTPLVEQQRSYLALDWMIREFLPTWLEQVDTLRAHAAEIRALTAISDLEAAEAAGPKVAAARAAARAAAGDGAGAAAWAAAWAAARDAAGDAAGDAAWAAAGAAARAAAWAAAWAAAGDAAWAAARAAARDAAGDGARAAAWDAARDGLNPTVTRLQDSACHLVQRMLALGGE